MRFSASAVRFACAAFLFASISTSHAQVLARPGWAGSGITTESWWRAAVFYRVVVREFQDSDGDGVGDLRGLASRMDYLQSLGVDAVVLEQPFDDAGFDELQREASRFHLRLIIELSAAQQAAGAGADSRDRGTARLLGEARNWLTRGAAGIYLRTSTLPPGVDAAQVVRGMRALTRSLPGDRILLAEPLPGAAARSELREDGAQLVDTALAISPRAPAASLSGVTMTFQSLAAGWPLLSAVPTADKADLPADAAQSEAWKKIIATVLLSSRGAMSLEYGQELGLENYPPDYTQTMRWTPSNRTDPNAPPPELAGQPAAPVERAQPRAPENVYGAFVPYQAPIVRPAKSPADLTLEKLNALPGFSTQAPPAPAPAAQPEVRDAATQDGTPSSLLNFYRRMMELHHGNFSLRNGTPYVLDHDREHALVLVRRAPANARTAATVVVVCNTSSAPLTLSLGADFERLRIRQGTLRPLIASWTDTPAAQNADSITLPAFGSFVGELYHDTVSGSFTGSGGNGRRHGRTRRPRSR